MGETLLYVCNSITRVLSKTIDLSMRVGCVCTYRETCEELMKKPTSFSKGFVTHLLHHCACELFVVCLNVVFCFLSRQCHERVYSATDGVEKVEFGLYIIRGDNMWVHSWHYMPFYKICRRITHGACLWNIHTCRAVIGEVDEDIDAQLNLSRLKADPLFPVKH